MTADTTVSLAKGSSRLRTREDLEARNPPYPYPPIPKNNCLFSSR